MKTIALKLDDYLLNILNKEAKTKKVTRMEIIRSAIVNFFINRKEEDALDLAYMHQHRNDKLITFEEAFKK